MMKFLGASLLTAMSLNVVASIPVQLMENNIEDVIDESKSVFLMFYDSECEEDCNDMSEAWNKLADDFEGHEHGIIAQIDCSSEEGIEVCQYFQIPSLPFFYWGGSMSWEDYQGELTYEAMSEHANKYISKPICSAYKEEYCEGEDLETLQKLQNMPEEEFYAMAEKAQEEIAAIGETFEEARQGILDAQDLAIDEFNVMVNEVMAKYNFSFVEQLIAKRTSGAASPTNDAEEKGSSDEL